MPRRKGVGRWLVTLREPSVQAILTQADNRDLRARVAKAYATRASDQAADPSHDNSARIDRILALRHEAAQLLGFRDAAARSVETKMAQSADEALAFLADLAARARPAGGAGTGRRDRLCRPEIRHRQAGALGHRLMSPSICAASASASIARRSAPISPCPA